MKYEYQQLPEGEYIRLLVVIEDRTTHKLTCDVQVRSLEDCKHDYIALSYTWGDDSPFSSIETTSGQSFPLSRTLTTLLQSLRQRHKSFTIWIDALCMNQEDNVEKAAQVQMMGKVYSYAEQVIVWLGDGTEESDAAFRYMHSKQTLSWPDGWDDSTDLSGLATVFMLLTRQWFRRIWVIQEAILNNNVLVLCGDLSIDFDNLTICTWAIWKYFDDLGDYEYMHVATRGLHCFTRLIALREEYQRAGSIRYEVLLEAAFAREAKDQRDRVFAFRGVANNSRPVPMPDYTVQLQDGPAYEAAMDDVFLKTATALLCHGQSLDLLALAGLAVRQRPTNLPSWVPNLRDAPFGEPFAVCDRGGWNAGGPLQESPTLRSPHHLRLRLIIIDEIIASSHRFDAGSVRTQQRTVREVLAFRDLLSPEIKEEVTEPRWYNDTAAALIMGLDVDDEPAGEEYKAYFDEWITWLRQAQPDQDWTGIKHNNYHRTVGVRIDAWKACLSRQGRLCIGSSRLKPGDKLCTVPGCHLPIVVRFVPGDAGGATQGVLLSWCYVQGWMYGEANTSDQPIVEVLL